MAKVIVKTTPFGNTYINGVRLHDDNKIGTKLTGLGYEGRVEYKWGYIDYIVFPKVQTIVFNGSWIDKYARGKGKYKILVKKLLDNWKGWKFHCLAISPLVARTLIKRFGFKKVREPLYYWGTLKGARGEKGTRLKRGNRVRKGIG